MKWMKKLRSFWYKWIVRWFRPHFKSLRGFELAQIDQLIWQDGEYDSSVDRLADFIGRNVDSETYGYYERTVLSYATMQSRLRLVQDYLDEKLGSYQICWRGPPFTVANYKRVHHHVGQNNCCLMRLTDIRYKYWNDVILSGLCGFVKQWNCQLYFMLGPDIDYTKSEAKVEDITLIFQFGLQPYKVKRQKH